MITHLDVLYRYERQPTEPAMIALAKVHEVYGIRRIRVNEAEKTIRGEVIAQLVRRTGIDIVEEMPLIPPQPEPDVESVPAIAK